MPELPEVQTVVATLQPKLEGRKIVAVRLNRPDIVRPGGFNLPSHLTGRRISSISRRGKKIILALDDGNRFVIHLGMSGRLTLETPGHDVPVHTHLILSFGDVEMRFRDPRRFGGVWWLGTSQPDENLGPEPLVLRPTQLARRLGKTTRAVKNALLDQALVAGLGNIYVDESLFAAGIHPLTAANQLSAAQIARRHRGSTLRDYRDANGQSGAFQRLHRVYAQTGKPCRTCKTPIERIVLGG